MNPDDSDDVGILLSNDFMCCQLQECLHECLAGGFGCLESHCCDADSYTAEETQSGDEDLQGSCAECVEVNNNDEYVIVTGLE